MDEFIAFLSNEVNVEQNVIIDMLNYDDFYGEDDDDDD